MAEKRMLIVDADVVKKIDENRGDMNRSEFISFIIDGQLGGDSTPESFTEYVDKEEFRHFERSIKELLRNFLEFFISYGLALGKQPQDKTFTELSQKLQSLGASDNKSKKL